MGRACCPCAIKKLAHDTYYDYVATVAAPQRAVPTRNVQHCAVMDQQRHTTRDEGTCCAGCTDCLCADTDHIYPGLCFNSSASQNRVTRAMPHIRQVRNPLACLQLTAPIASLSQASAFRTRFNETRPDRTRKPVVRYCQQPVSNFVKPCTGRALHTSKTIRLVTASPSISHTILHFIISWIAVSA